MSKSEYRNTILRMMKYVKVTKFCNSLGIATSNLSYFLKGRDERMSIDKLELLVNTIRSELECL